MMNMMSNTSMTSINGVVFISTIGGMSRTWPGENEEDIACAIASLLRLLSEMIYHWSLLASGFPQPIDRKEKRRPPKEPPLNRSKRLGLEDGHIGFVTHEPHLRYLGLLRHRQDLVDQDVL